jgi:hypothetical protein
MLTHDQPYHDLGPDHYTDRLNRTGKTPPNPPANRPTPPPRYDVTLNPTHAA